MDSLILGRAEDIGAHGISVDEVDADELVAEIEACVAHRLGSTYARARLTEALYEIVLDGLHPCPRSLPDPADRAWLRDSLTRPIEQATDAALRVLVAETLTALDRAPGPVLSCLVDLEH